MNNDKRILKKVFTLNSGKSIVVSITEKECLEAHDKWVRYIYKNQPLDENSPLAKIPVNEIITFMKKDNNDRLIEISTIKTSEIASIQILQNSRDRNEENF